MQRFADPAVRLYGVGARPGADLGTWRPEPATRGENAVVTVQTEGHNGAC